MQKIFELTPAEFATGLGPSSQVQDQGLWHKAYGITVMRDPFGESDNFGILQAAPSPTDISTAAIAPGSGTTAALAGVPWAWTIRSTSTVQKLYFTTNDADTDQWLYQIDLVSDATPENVFNNSSLSGNPASGLFYFKHSTGAEYLYYAQLAQWGRYGNLAGTPGATADYSTGWQSTKWHSTHQVFDTVYACNGRYIATFVDDGAGGMTINKTALDLDPAERANCLNDDGQYLVIGATKNQSTSNLIRGGSRVLFWDGNQSSWQREWPIPDASILGIRRVGSVMYAVTSRGTFAFTFNSPPVPVIPYMPAITPDPTYPTQAATDVMSEAILFGGAASDNSGGMISSFGRLAPQAPRAFFHPFAGFGTGTVSLVAASAKTGDIVVGTTQEKLYRVKWTGAGQTGVSGETIYIDLKRWWQVRKLVIEFDSQLASGDDFSIEVQPDDVVSSTTFGSATYAAHGAIRNREIYSSIEARKLKLIVNFNGGTPRIRSISAYGDPLQAPTHTRT